MKPIIFKPKRIKTNLNLDDCPDLKLSFTAYVLDKIIDRFFKRLVIKEIKAIDEKMMKK